jgi:hypothetical protein
VLCREEFCPFEPEGEEVDELGDAAEVAAVEVDETPVADAPATACAFCADALGDVALCACASN